MITIQTLHNDIVGLLYDIKELLTTYRGNLIALCVGIAVAVFNYNRPNAGMLFPFFFLKKKRSTRKFYFPTTYFQEDPTEEEEEEEEEETTIGIYPTKSDAEGI